MKPTRILLSALSALLFIVTPHAWSQTDLDLPLASQAAEVRQRIGVTDITITYHRPLVNGRKIWGALVPFGKVWRAGANENTTIEFGTPVSVEGKPLAAGKYGLHMIPNPDSWTVIFSKMAVAWGSYSYNEAEDALRVDVKPHPTSEMEEALEYEFENLKPDSVDATLKWEKLAVPFHISLNEPETVIASIRNQLRGRAQYSWAPLNEAAQYCLTKKIDLEDGLKWADQSIQIEERFDNLETKADLLLALNRPDEAKKVRDHAMEVAKPADLYAHARQLQQQKRSDEAMQIFRELTKRAPQNVFGHLAQARIKSAASDFDGALAEAKAAQAAAPSDPQKKAIQQLVDRLQAKQDINK
jgi:tetratricopeptide (TPR) repeat protein